MPGRCELTAARSAGSTRGSKGPAATAGSAAGNQMVVTRVRTASRGAGRGGRHGDPPGRSGRRARPTPLGGSNDTGTGGAVPIGRGADGVRARARGAGSGRPPHVDTRRPPAAAVMGARPTPAPGAPAAPTRRGEGPTRPSGGVQTPRGASTGQTMRRRRQRGPRRGRAGRHGIKRPATARATGSASRAARPHRRSASAPTTPATRRDGWAGAATRAPARRQRLHGPRMCTRGAAAAPPRNGDDANGGTTDGGTPPRGRLAVHLNDALACRRRQSRHHRRQPAQAASAWASAAMRSAPGPPARTRAWRLHGMGDARTEANSTRGEPHQTGHCPRPGGVCRVTVKAAPARHGGG